MLSLHAFRDAEACLRATVAIMAVGSCLSDLELLSVSSAFRDNGLLSWRAARITSRPFHRAIFARLTPLFSYPGIVVLLLARLLAGAMCLGSAIHGPVFAPFLGAYVAISLLIHLRPLMGNNGADKMLLLTAVTCLIALLRPSPFAKAIALVFLASQLSLAYAVSCWMKLSQPKWRSGHFLTNIFATSTFGKLQIHRSCVRWPRIAMCASGAVVIIECLGSIAPWVPAEAAVVFLGGVMLFHLAAAYIMGLNTFVFAFIAVYPAALHTSLLLYR